MKNKIISLILAICLVASFLPSFPQTFAAGETVVYDLNINMSSGTKIKGFKYADTGNVWEWHSSNPESKGTANASAHSWGGIDTNSTAQGQWLAVKIKINEAGEYSALLTHGQSSSQGGYGNIYLLPGSTTDVATDLSGATPIGEDVCYYNASGNVKSTTTELSDVVIEEGKTGEYILVFYASKAGNTGYRMYPKSITLTKKASGGDVEPPKVYSGYKAIYDFMQTATDGRETTYETTSNFWSFGSTNSDWETNADSFKKRSYGLQIQKLSSGNWAAFKINVPAEGTYKVTVGHITAGQGGVSQVYIMPKNADVGAGLSNPAYKLSGTVDFYSEAQTTTPTGTYIGDYAFESSGEHLVVFTYVGNSPNYTGTLSRSAHYLSYLELDGGDEALPMSITAELMEDVTVGTSAFVSVTALMSDGTEQNVELSELDFKSSDEAIATVDASGLITGVSEGSTIITVETKNKSASASFSVKVGKQGSIKKKFTYDFNEGIVIGEKLSSITEYGDARGLWKYREAKGATSANSVTHKWGAELRTSAEGDWVALRIKVTSSARYFAILTHGQSNTNGGYGDVYIIPDNVSDIDAALSEFAPIGENVPYYNPVNAEAIDRELSGIDLKAGVYNLVFKATKAGISGYRQYPGVLVLDSSNIFRFLDFETDKTVLTISADGEKEKTGSSFEARLLDGTVIPTDELDIIYGTEDDTVAECTDGIITAVGHGKTNVYVTVSHNGRTMTTKQEITVKDTSGICDVIISSDKVNFAGEKVKLSAKAIFNSGNEIKLSDSDVAYEIVGEFGEVTEDSYVTLNCAGKVSVCATVTLGDESFTGEPYELEFREPTTKTEPTYHTYERREAARENAEKYAWAKQLSDAAVKGADGNLETYEYLYDHITGEGLPRSKQVGAEGDPDYIYCRYCGNDNMSEYGNHRASGYFDVNIYAKPWKLQCPDCKRLFPSNDFALLYSRGLDAQGYYDRDRAVKANAEAVANGEKDALHNDLYPELYDATKETCNRDPRTGVKVDGARWGVDDGLGYLPGRTYANGVEERHGYIAYYTHEIWFEVNRNLLNLGRAYLYTGEKKYGRATAVLIDRIADVFPSFSYKQWDNMYLVAHGGSGFGKIFGRINDCTYTTTFIQYADAAYPMYDDPQVIKFLSEKAAERGLENSKTSGEKIWANIEDGLLRESFRAAKEGNISGNYGLQQRMLAAAALVLSREPESSSIIDWIYQPGEWSEDRTAGTAKCTGGNLSVQLVNAVDRDGAGDEASPNYNSSWIENLYECADMLQMYSADAKYDLYQNPKFAKMFTVYIPLVLMDSYTAQIGDSGATASVEDYQDSIDLLLRGFRGLKDSPLGNLLAEYIYKRNGNTAKGLHYDIFTKDPESMEKDILALIDEDLAPQSEMLPGYGFAVLRDGAKYADEGHITHQNNMRDFWIYFGRNQGHGHLDTLNLGIEAFGLNFAPDNGYPEVTSTDPHRYQWLESTIAHNTVTVNKKSQKDIGFHGFPKHFDDAGEVKIMDVDASNAYTETDIYRRTVLMINAGDDVSYGVDFFRVKGGYDHIYSFHSQSEEIVETEGLGEIKYQTDDGTENGNYIGSYAGADVPYGPDPSNSHVVADFIYPRGYTWMKNIRRAENVGDFSVDFKVQDYRGVLDNSKGLRIRMTMLNDFVLDEVALTSGNVPSRSANKGLPKTFEYVLARRYGEELDTLYTAVYEPYRNERYISDMSSLEISSIEGKTSADDVARAVKVTRRDGRIDYIMYATENTVLYTVTDGDRKINFRGFVGIYSVNSEGETIYTYVHDGDVIGEYAGMQSSIRGTISDFTRELSLENEILVRTEDEFDTASLVDKYVFVENDGVQNAVYRIYGAEKTDEGLKLDIGTVSAVRSYKDSENVELGFVYNIARGQKIAIPLSNVNDGAPVFDKLSDNISASAGSSITVRVNATCEDESEVSYIATSLPRGATLDGESGSITWKPTSSQIGDNHFAITAVDSKGREKTIHFIITVYGSTGGGAGGASAPGTPTETPTIPATKPDDKDNVGDSSDNAGTGVPDGPQTPSTTERFVDLGNHAWAKDAINSLADEGIIKGTSENTFSPAANITRADFAILLVRAFELASENEENFADVSSSDYFAKELAIARNTGLVNGIGDNKFAPRNNITRQDMMVIVYRALKSMNKLDVGDGVLDGPQASDYANVSDYAREAVSALVNAGIVNGKNGLIAPMDYTTRAEVAVLINRILKL